MAAKQTTGARSAATVLRGIRAATVLRGIRAATVRTVQASDSQRPPFERYSAFRGIRAADAAGLQRRESRSLFVCLIFALLVHAGIGLALLFGLSPVPPILRRAVSIDLVSGGPAEAAPPEAASPRAGIARFRAAAPAASAQAPTAAAAAPGAPPSQQAAASPAAAEAPGGAAGSDAQAGAAAPVDSSWEVTGPGNGRPPVFVVHPDLPSWVSQKGIALAVTVAFTVTPNGIVSGVHVSSSSGFVDVDAAVSEAVMMWHFSSDPSAGAVLSAARFVVKARGPR